MTDIYFFDLGEVGIFNIVALLDMPEVLNALEKGAEYSLTSEQRQQALRIIEQVKQEPQADLLECN